MDWSLILQYKTWMYSIWSTSMGFLMWKNIRLATKTSHLCLLEAEILQNSCFGAAILKSKMAATTVVRSRVSGSYIKEHTKCYQCANFHTFFTKWTIFSLIYCTNVEHSNPGGTSTKQFPCQFCSKSYQKKSNLCPHEQSTHRQTLIGLEPGSYKTIRPKKFNLNGETGPCNKSRNKEAELALENLLSDDEPDENAMIDLTVTNKQHLLKGQTRSIRPNNESKRRKV